MKNDHKSFRLLSEGLNPVFDGNSPNYWRELKEGHRLISAAQKRWLVVCHAHHDLKHAEGFLKAEARFSVESDWVNEAVDACAQRHLDAHQSFIDACHAIDGNIIALRILASRRIREIGGYRFAY